MERYRKMDFIQTIDRIFFNLRDNIHHGSNDFAALKLAIKELQQVYDAKISEVVTTLINNCRMVTKKGDDLVHIIIARHMTVGIYCDPKYTMQMSDCLCYHLKPEEFCQDCWRAYARENGLYFQD